MRVAPSEVTRASHPAARLGVSAEPASPLGVVRPFSVLSAGEVAAYWLDRALLRPWILAGPGPWSLPSPTAPRAVSVAWHIHSWVFTLLQGMAGANPSTASPFTRSALDGTVPLLGFRSLQRSPARRVRFSRWFPRHRHLASSGFFALSTPYSPSSLPTVARRAAPGIATFRALLLPTGTAPFRACPEPS